MLSQSILKELKSDQFISTNNLSKRLKMRRDFLQGYLQALHDSGKIKRIVVGRSIGWSL